MVVYEENGDTYKLKNSCRVILAHVSVRMSDQRQSSVAFSYVIKSGVVRYLENGVIVVFDFNRSHIPLIIEAEVLQVVG